MAAEYDEEGPAVAAAKILLSLRTRKLTRWPDWILPPPSKEPAAPAKRLSVEVEPEVDLPPPLPEGWPKRPRGPLRVRVSGWSLSLDGLFARLRQPAPARSGASSSEEERAWSPPRVRKANRRSSEVHGSASGSGPSTSGVERPRPRPRVTVKVGAARKEAFMAASSPETPFDYANAARSGASSSGDEGARSTAKRKARGASRSGAPSSSGEDEGCSNSPAAKRARPDFHQDDAAGAAVKVEVPKIEEENNRDEKGHLLFDLNEDISMAW